MLEVNLAIRHSVTTKITNIHHEIDSYFDRLDEQVRKDIARDCEQGSAGPINATGGEDTNQYDFPDNLENRTVGGSGHGWESLSAEKVPTPPLRIQKRRVQ